MMVPSEAPVDDGVTLPNPRLDAVRIWNAIATHRGKNLTRDRGGPHRVWLCRQHLDEEGRVPFRD